MKKWRALFMLFVVISLVGCIKIPIGDGNNVGLSKDRITIIDDEDDEVSISVGDDNEMLTICCIDDETGNVKNSMKKTKNYVLNFW